MTEGALQNGLDTTGLRALLYRLRLGFVEKFGDSKQGEVVMPKEITTGRLDLANIVTSRHPAAHGEQPKHALLLDIDHPAWLIKSSTEGHYHLYIDVPGGIEHEDYMLLLTWLAKCKVIEEGYMSTSRSRGFTSLRLPWIKKKDTP